MSMTHCLSHEGCGDWRIPSRHPGALAICRLYVSPQNSAHISNAGPWALQSLVQAQSHGARARRPFAHYQPPSLIPPLFRASCAVPVPHSQRPQVAHPPQRLANWLQRTEVRSFAQRTVWHDARCTCYVGDRCFFTAATAACTTLLCGLVNSCLVPGNGSAPSPASTHPAVALPSRCHPPHSTSRP